MCLISKFTFLSCLVPVQKCQYCNMKMIDDANCFCNKNCEILYIYSDSISSSDKSAYKYILNLDV